MKRMTVAVLVFVVVLAGSIVLRGGGSPAQAYAHIGCKWHTNQLGDLRFSSPNKYKTAVREAFGAWNTEAAWFGVKFKEVTSNFDIVHQSLSSGPDGYFGSTYSNCVDGYFPTGWMKPVMYLNTYYLDQQPKKGRRAVASHEFGHLLGLDHEQYVGGGCSTYPVMRNGSLDCANWIPTVDDLNGIYTLYY